VKIPPNQVLSEENYTSGENYTGKTLLWAMVGTNGHFFCTIGNWQRKNRTFHPVFGYLCV
jgi:hypothetical protein